MKTKKSSFSENFPASKKALKVGLAIHGGAGVIRRGDLSPRKEKQYVGALERVLLRGWRLLQGGASCLDAVELAVKLLEDSPLFNAGKGSALTEDRIHELDASIMNGSDLRAGAVASLHHIKNPVVLARRVMEESPHVMLVGEGAEKFAQRCGMGRVEQKYFFTPSRLEALERLQERERQIAQNTGQSVKIMELESPSDKHGTVGAVALDHAGHLAAATSTGGMTNKSFGRIGDTPIIGAGTYANHLCAVSCTGWGEHFIRLSVARDIAALMEYQNKGVQEAADIVVQGKLKVLGGEGGVIAIDRFGNIGVSFHAEGMYRAHIDPEGQSVTRIYGD